MGDQASFRKTGIRLWMNYIELSIRMPKSVYTDIINQLSFWISSGCLSLFSTDSLSLHVFIKFPGARSCVPMYPDIHVYISSVDCYSLGLAGVWLCNFVNIFHVLYWNLFHGYITSFCQPSWGWQNNLIRPCICHYSVLSFRRSVPNYWTSGHQS